LLRLLCRNEPAEGIGETRRCLVPRLTLADSRVRRRSEVIAVAHFADHGRETEVVELPAEDTCVEGDPPHFPFGLPKNTKAEKRFLSRAEVSRLADAASQYPIPDVGEQYRVLVLVPVFCGLRWERRPGSRSAEWTSSAVA
jgi:hypothetical protein